MERGRSFFRPDSSGAVKLGDVAVSSCSIVSAGVDARAPGNLANGRDVSQRRPQTHFNRRQDASNTLSSTNRTRPLHPRGACAVAALVRARKTIFKPRSWVCMTSSGVRWTARPTVLHSLARGGRPSTTKRPHRFSRIFRNTSRCWCDETIVAHPALRDKPAVLFLPTLEPSRQIGQFLHRRGFSVLGAWGFHKRIGDLSR